MKYLYGIILLLVFRTGPLKAQKPVFMHFSNTHAENSIDVYLYSDSTYLVHESANFYFFGTNARKRGTWSMQGNSVSFIQREKLYFLFFGKAHRYKWSTYKMEGSDLITGSRSGQRSVTSRLLEGYELLFGKSG